jgi:hypothetical protein
MKPRMNPEGFKRSRDPWGVHPIGRLAQLRHGFPAGRGAAIENAFRSARLIQHDFMNQKSAGWSRTYQTALQECLEQESHASLQSASRLGSEALALGLQALALARIHERARAILEPGGREKTLIRRAEIPFTQAAAPVVKRAAPQTRPKLL